MYRKPPDFHAAPWGRHHSSSCGATSAGVSWAAIWLEQDCDEVPTPRHRPLPVPAAPLPSPPLSLSSSPSRRRENTWRKSLLLEEGLHSRSSGARFQALSSSVERSSSSASSSGPSTQLTPPRNCSRSSRHRPAGDSSERMRRSYEEEYGGSGTRQRRRASGPAAPSTFFVLTPQGHWKKKRSPGCATLGSAHHHSERPAAVAGGSPTSARVPVFRFQGNREKHEERVFPSSSPPLTQGTGRPPPGPAAVPLAPLPSPNSATLLSASSRSASEISETEAPPPPAAAAAAVPPAAYRKQRAVVRPTRRGGIIPCRSHPPAPRRSASRDSLGSPYSSSSSSDGSPRPSPSSSLMMTHETTPPLVRASQLMSVEPLHPFPSPVRQQQQQQQQYDSTAGSAASYDDGLNHTPQRGTLPSSTSLHAPYAPYSLGGSSSPSTRSQRVGAGGWTSHVEEVAVTSPSPSRYPVSEPSCASISSFRGWFLAQQQQGQEQPPPQSCPDEEVEDMGMIGAMATALKEKYAMEPNEEAKGLETLQLKDVRNLVKCFYVDVYRTVKQAREEHGKSVAQFRFAKDNPTGDDSILLTQPAPPLLTSPPAPKPSPTLPRQHHPSLTSTPPRRQRALSASSGGAGGVSRNLSASEGRRRRSTSSTVNSRRRLRSSPSVSSIRCVPLPLLLPRLLGSGPTLVGMFAPLTPSSSPSTHIASTTASAVWGLLGIRDCVSFFQQREVLMPHLVWRLDDGSSAAQDEDRQSDAGDGEWCSVNLLSITAVAVGSRHSPGPLSPALAEAARAPHHPPLRFPLDAHGYPAIISPQGRRIGDCWVASITFTVGTGTGASVSSSALTVCFLSEDDRQLWVGALMGVVTRNAELAGA